VRYKFSVSYISVLYKLVNLISGAYDALLWVLFSWTVTLLLDDLVSQLGLYCAKSQFDSFQLANTKQT
jgi:hypothetical protein